PGAGKGLVLGFAATLTVLLLNGLASSWNVRRLIDNDRRLVHTHQVLARLEEALSALKDAETGQRGYLLTGRPEYLRDHEQAPARGTEALDDLEDLTADNPAQQQRLRQLRGLA